MNTTKSHQGTFQIEQPHNPGYDPIELARGVHEATPNAEDALVRQFTPGLMIMLRRRCAEPNIAEDLCQETLIVVIARLRERPLEEPAKLAGFIHGIAKNLVWADIKKRIRHRTDADMEKIYAAESNAEEAWQEVYHGELKLLIEEKIASLSIERDRQILTRRYLHEQSTEQITRDLGLSGRQYNSILHRARQRLRSAIENSESQLTSEVMEAIGVSLA